MIRVRDAFGMSLAGLGRCICTFAASSIVSSVSDCGALLLSAIFSFSMGFSDQYKANLNLVCADASHGETEQADLACPQRASTCR